MRPNIAIYLFLLLTSSAIAQNNLLSKRVSFHFDGIRLQEALADLSSRYQLHFSYSSDIIPVRKKMYVSVNDLPLSTAFDRLFESTQIVYSVVGEHIVLKINPNKSLGSLGSGKQSSKPPVKSPLKEEQVVLVSNPEPPAPKKDTLSAEPLEMPEAQVVKPEGKMHPFDETLLNFEKWRYEAGWATQQHGKEKRIAQISVLPFIGTNTWQSDEVTNNVSMNLLWGVSGGVDGLEVGTFVNSVRNDVKGVQAAGLGNMVGHNVTGTQVGGIFNYTGGRTRGLQAAGIFNFSRQTQAAQASGIMNFVREDAAGLQAAGLFNRAGSSTAIQAAGIFNLSRSDAKVQIGGLFNVAGGNSGGMQAAGIFNSSRGNVRVQIGGLFNRAKDVGVAQVGGFMNVAKEVKGLQLGFINISDTVSGIPIGFLNIVKKGYNKFEIYGSESLHGNLQLKLGAHSFYNIFHVGARYPEGNGNYIWGFGYGIGMASTLSPRHHLNYELMAIHNNENEAWTNQINSIGQFRFLWNQQLGKSIGFFLGPTANLMLSQRHNPETGELGSGIVPYALMDDKIGSKTSMKGWVGVNAGFRF